MDRELISKIAQEAHTMGRIYENVLSPVNPAIEFGNVEKMIDRFLKSVAEGKSTGNGPL